MAGGYSGGSAQVWLSRGGALKEKREKQEADPHLQEGAKGAATEPRGSLSLADSPRTKPGPVPRVEVGVVHPELQGACCMLGAGGADIVFLPSTLPALPPMPLICPTNPGVPGVQGDPQVIADTGRGVEQG